MPRRRTGARGIVVLALLLVGALTVPQHVAAAPPAAATAATGHVVGGTTTAPYIVTLRGGATAAEVLGRHPSLRSGRTFSRALRGFTTSLTPSAATDLQADPAVAAVEPDGLMRADAAQAWPTWGLDRIDQPGRRLNRTYAYDGYGTGVNAYIVDSGVRRHAEFGSRLSRGYASRGGSGRHDCAGHGTHVAGTVGGSRFGVAKRVRIVPVRVGGCGTFIRRSDVIGGLDFIVGHHAPGSPAVANISLGGAPSPAADRAVRGVLRAGVTVVVAAGNEDADACNFSPARIDGVLTVGAVNGFNRAPDWSNSGPCVDVFAPGVDIRSASANSFDADRVASGTSMAAPHVAGVAARYLAKHPGASPAAVHRFIVRSAKGGVVRNAGARTTERMLYAPGRVPTEIVMANGDSAEQWGGTVAIGAALYNRVTNRPMAARSMRLYSRRPGTSTWRRLATKSTNKYGGVTFRRAAERSTIYQVRHPGSTTSGSRRAESIRVDVLPADTRLSISVSSEKVDAGERVVVKGVLRRATDGRAVADHEVRLYWSDSLVWAYLDGRTNDNGVVTFEQFPTSTTTYELHHGGTGKTNDTYSGTKTVTVVVDPA